MIDYRGQTCIVCNEQFSQTDDVVVCPECGTPYHRSCYQAQGRCINTELHENGGSWQLLRNKEIEEQKRAAHREEMAQQAAARQREGNSNFPNAPMYDGIRMNNDPCLGLDPAEQLDGVTIKEMSSFIATNRFYYLPLFRMMQQTGKMISFNLSCMLFPELYFANRKMWGMTLLSAVLQLILALPSMLFTLTQQMGYTIDWVNTESIGFSLAIYLTGLIEIAFTLLCCLFGNYLYYRFAIRKIKKAKKNAPSEEALHTELQQAGGTNMLNAILVITARLILLRLGLYLI